MVTHIHSYGSCLSESQARIQARGDFFLGCQNFDKNNNNGAILNISKINKIVWHQLLEECAPLFISSKESIV